ncbi:hypothetical protein A2872_00720 [Candidatus Gottesmanbacteria bacterium RIFCSPHIGHO2_01_FULL_42_12]|uniref:GIY-YIG domain-containing protein n=1 Tax=Candidatus Gottesmanbacteria bacterium RIFCSPHIGHO2_01_FULL_42_12 TaxID=1798377 RepID=A0A1F5YZT0_9BACT|nr:MAG: hypothetical protein A2872_00720 [Candidatus Gottesmanbacteria bacterium RIFCSPHIGHO2_01_FULL_42_12]
MGTVYILKSQVNGRYYIGSTFNLETRLQEHNSGKSKYTSLTIPFELVFSQNYNSIQLARNIEYRLKKLKSKKVIDRIISDGVIKLGW